MIKKIAHLADIHFREPSRETEYAEVFEEIYKVLDQNPVDRILIAGDIFHTKNNVKNETKVFAKKVLLELAKRAKIILINGNHDGNPNNVSQLTSLETLVRLIDHPNITYYNKTGIYQDENVSWIVWDYFDGLNPYEVDNWLPLDNVQIDLYHNPVNECLLFTGQTLEHSHSTEKFRGDFFFLGDIHKRQFFENVQIIEVEKEELQEWLDKGWEIFN